MWPNHLYARTRREITFDRDAGRVISSRLDQGCSEAEGERISAVSGLDPLRSRDRDLAEALDDVSPPRLPSKIPDSIDRATLVVTRTAIVGPDTSDLIDESWAFCSNRSDRRICRPDEISRLRLLEKRDDRKNVSTSEPSVETLLFTAGSAALIFHELLGHGEGAAGEREWPASLEVLDVPVQINGEDRLLDDVGEKTSTRDLLAGDPLSLRRAGFRDLPLRRMFRMRVDGKERAEQPDTPFITIRRIAEGRYDEMSRRGEWLVAESSMAALDGSVSDLGPWKLRLTLSELHARLESVGGSVVEHPPMLCSDRGQRIPVSHFSADMILRGR